MSRAQDLAPLAKWVCSVGVCLALLANPWAYGAPANPLQAALQAIDRSADSPVDQPVAAVPLDKQRELVRQALDQTRQGELAERPSPLLGERLRLLERLLVLIEGRLQLEAESAAEAGAGLLAAPVAARLLAAPDAPPYPVPLLDALRDERDLLASRVQLLDTELTTQEASLIRLNEDKRKASEARRLLAERVAMGREPRSAPQTREKELIAQLRLQVHETELLLTHDARERTRQTLSQQRKQLLELEPRLQEWLRHPRLDESDLRPITQEVQQRRERIAQDSEANDSRQAELVLQAQAGGGEAMQSAQRQERAVRRAMQASLASLDAIEQATLDAWTRRVTMHGQTDIEARQAAGAFIRQALERLAAQAPVDAGQLAAARQAAREQQQRLDRLDPGTSGIDAERALLKAQQQAVGLLERSQQAMSLLQRLYQRSDEELASREAHLGFSERLRDAWSWLSLLGQRMWQHELFAASDTSVIDGRTVTVQYGVTVGKSVGAVLLFILGYWLAGKLAALGERALVSRFEVNPQLARVLKRWVLFSGALVVMVIVLNLARIPLTVFAFLGGALAIGIGFGTQNIIKNLISGVIILFERKVRVGDIVTIGTVTGTVSAVDLRATSVRGFDGIESILPNSNLLENQVSNWTYPAPLLRRQVKVGIAYDSDPAEAARLITDCALVNANVLKDPRPAVLFENFGDNSLELCLLYWLRLPGLVSGPELDSQLRFAILDALRQAGIPIAYPQRDVHLDMPQALRVEVVSP